MTVTVTGGSSATVSGDGSSVTITATTPTVTVSSGGGGGVTDHGALTGLADDDHSQYHNDARGDLRYQPLDSDLTAIAALTTTSFGRALLALADDAAGRTALGLGTAATTASTAYETAGAVATHAGAADPHGDRAAAATALSAAQWAPIACHLGDFPRTPATSGSWSLNVAATSVSMWPYWNVTTQNAYIELTSWLWLPAGTFDVSTHGNRNTDKGIATVALDGSSIGTADFYGSAGAVFLPVATGLVVASPGFKTVRISTPTKNASSSGYGIRVSTLIFERTA